MDIIEAMLTGQIDMPAFSTCLKKSEQLKLQINALIPDEAKKCGDHDLWKCISYQALREHAFDFCELLLDIHHFDGTIADNYSAFCSIQAVYCYHYPALCCTKKYKLLLDVYLDVIGDCFDGPEVLKLVEQIIEDSLQFSSRAKRIKYAKTKIAAAFHEENRKKPRWIQGPEWPMGTCSPMAFIAQKKVGESVHYEFKDVDTGEMRVVEQYY